MKTRKKTIKVSKQKAIELAMNCNCITREIAERYTNNELKEVLRLLSGRAITLKADF